MKSDKDTVLEASKKLGAYVQSSHRAALRRGCDGGDEAYAIRAADKAAAERMADAASAILDGGETSAEVAELAARWIAFLDGHGPRPGN